MAKNVAGFSVYHRQTGSGNSLSRRGLTRLNEEADREARDLLYESGETVHFDSPDSCKMANMASERESTDSLAENFPESVADLTILRQKRLSLGQTRLFFRRQGIFTKFEC